MNHPPHDEDDRDGRGQIEPRPDIPALNDPRAYEEYTKGRNEKRGTKNRRKSRRRMRRGVKFAAEIATVVLTAGVLWITNRQAGIMEAQTAVMKSQNRIAEKQRRLQVTAQRAWILPDWQTMKAGFFSDQAIGVAIKNFGLAPGFNVGGVAQVMKNVAKLPEGFACPDFRPSSAVKFSWLLASQESEVVIVEDDFSGVTKVTMVLSVTYDDPFGKNRRTLLALHAHRDAHGWEWHEKKTPGRFGREERCNEAK